MNQTFKILVAGDDTTGKTSIIKRLVENTFSPETKPTVGAEFFATELKMGQQKVNLVINDFGGAPQFKNIIAQYCKGANGAIIVFDLTRPTTFKDVREIEFHLK